MACFAHIETQIFVVTQLDPMFIMLPSLLNSRRQQQSKMSPTKPRSLAAANGSDMPVQGETQFEDLNQILTSINIQQDDEVIEIQDTPCSDAEMSPRNGNQQIESLKELLYRSASLERALSRMCQTREFTHPTNGQMTRLYSFDLNKCMEHFAGKYDKIKRHLAVKYVQENRGFILKTRQGAQTRRTVIKQEAKAVKAESGVKSEAAGVKNEPMADEEINPTEYESQFEVMAMGIVADELPHSCVEPFLKYIKDNHQGSAQLFQTFTGGPGPNQIKAEEQEN